MMDGDSDNESDFEFVQDEFRNDLDDQDMPRVNRIWINVPDADLFQFPDEIQTFSRPMGPVRALTPDVNANPIDYFNSLVTPSDSASLMELLVRETNRYAEQFLSDPGYDPKPNSRSHDWHETDIEEMSAYIGLILSMGILKTPSIESYWQEKESTWLFQTPGFSAVMRRDRFQLISKFLHCNDNTTYIPRGQDGYDSCHKFRPVLDLVNKTFPKAYNLARDLTVDESMVGFKGRNDIVQYVPAKKSHQWGAKFFVLCESDTGYNVSLELYTGKQQNEMRSPFGIGYDVVMRLMQPHLNRYHHVVLDNYFSSPTLCEALYRENTYMTGTTRVCRKGMPKSLRGLRLAKGDSVIKQSGQIMALCYGDRKTVTFLSTLCTPE